MPDPDLTTLRHVGAATAAVLREAGVTATAIAERAVDHETLLEAGVNPGVAARIRREHSLAWSNSTGGDLSRRAAQVSGLGAAERDWVAASAGDWTAHQSAGGSDDAPGAPASEDPGPTTVRPVTDVAAVSEADAARLAEAGVTSLRTLATANAARVADSLDLSLETVARWQRAARAARR